jgi:hypothetical protein
MVPEGDDPAETTKARHEVMELVRGNSELSHLVLRLRDSGMSWLQVKAAIQAEINGGSGSPQWRASDVHERRKHAGPSCFTARHPQAARALS